MVDLTPEQLEDMLDRAAKKGAAQALLDITSHSNWPNLEDADWPVKP